MQKQINDFFLPNIVSMYTPHADNYAYLYRVATVVREDDGAITCDVALIDIAITAPT